MADFKTKKIRKKLNKFQQAKTNNLMQQNTQEKNNNPSYFKETIKNLKKSNNPSLNFFKKNKEISIVFIIIALIVIITFTGITKAISGLSLNTFLKIAGNELKTDAYGHTNFLLLGADDEAHLTDSIIIISLDNKNKITTMVSIPRDYYIQDSTLGNSRINAIYINAKNYYGDSKKAINHLKSNLEIITGIPIHYFVKIDFEGFEKIIDIIGGIDIFVPRSINDPYYPKDGTILFEPFRISAGHHTMNGKTALKYARSRKTTSDFDRSQRQQDIINAIKNKVLEDKVYFNVEKISQILETLKKHLVTNLTVQEIFTLATLTENFSSESINQRTIHDDPNRCGGLLYTPMRDFYNGMFVLIPAGGDKFMQKYLDLNFNFPEIGPQNEKIHILNGTRQAGIAGEQRRFLQRFCFNVIRFGNARTQNITETTYYYTQKYDENRNEINSRPTSLNFLQKIIPGKETTEIPEEYREYLFNADLIIELGSDYTTSSNYIKDPFLALPPALIRQIEGPAQPTEETNSTTDTPNTDTPPQTEETTEIPIETE